MFTGHLDISFWEVPDQLGCLFKKIGLKILIYLDRYIKVFVG